MRVRSILGDAWRICRSDIDYWLLAFVVTLLTAFSNFAYLLPFSFIARNSVSGGTPWLSLFAYALALLALGASVVTIFFRATLIDAVAARIMAGEKPHVRIRLRRMVDNWKRLLGFALLFLVPSLFFTIPLLGLTDYLLGSLTSGTLERGAIPPALFLIPFLCCGFFPVIIVVSVLEMFAVNGLVVEGLGIGDSIRRGAKMLRLGLSDFIRFALFMLAIVVVSMTLIQPLMAPIDAAVEAPIASAVQACIEQNMEPAALIECTTAAQTGLHAMFAQLLTSIIRSAPNSLITLFGTVAFTVFYCKLLTSLPARLPPIEPCDWQDARSRLIAGLDPAYQISASLSDENDLITAHLRWCEQRVADPMHRFPLMTAAGELLCVHPAIDVVIAEVVDEEGDVQGIGMWMRSAMEARALNEFVYERIE